MNRFDHRHIAFALAVCGISGGAEPLMGSELLDLTPFGYVFRADAPAGTNPPQTQWLTNGASRVLAGVMWEEHRPVQRIEVEFAGAAPEISQLILEVTTSTPTEKQNNRPTWWTRAYETFPGLGARTDDPRRIAYETSREAIIRRLDNAATPNPRWRICSATMCRTFFVRPSTNMRPMSIPTKAISCCSSASAILRLLHSAASRSTE